ncbi:hypothetical protein AMECASPLE_022920 [Ameca splendens]|uniref:Uncharacterized protein n=1 Tax=Ameca splendens TaxID=208324 RepID=A0ABV1ABE5_9TELE
MIHLSSRRSERQSINDVIMHQYCHLCALVMEKFSFQPQLFTEGILVLTDTSDTEVDSDIFDELVKTGVRAFKVGCRKQPATVLWVWM